MSLKAKLKQINSKRSNKNKDLTGIENLPEEGEINQEQNEANDEDKVPRKPNLDDLTEDLIRVE